MRMDEVREQLRAQPFRPFWVHLADGGRLPVNHQDFMALDPLGTEMIVYLPNGAHQVVDLMLVTRLEVRKRNGVSGAKGAQR